MYRNHSMHRNRRPVVNSHGWAAVSCVSSRASIVAASDARAGVEVRVQGGYRKRVVDTQKAAGKRQTFPPLVRWCPRWDSNPHSEEPDFESGASANSATRAYHAFVRNTFRILTQAV